MLLGPPWITTNSGYFREATKPGGRTRKLCMRLPRLEVNQKLSIGGRSSCAARAALNRVSGVGLPFDGLISATSPGTLALSQLAYSARPRARAGITRLLYEPW